MLDGSTNPVLQLKAVSMNMRSQRFQGALNEHHDRLLHVPWDATTVAVEPQDLAVMVVLPGANMSVSTSTDQRVVYAASPQHPPADQPLNVNHLHGGTYSLTTQLFSSPLGNHRFWGYTIFGQPPYVLITFFFPNGFGMPG